MLISQTGCLDINGTIDDAPLRKGVVGSISAVVCILRKRLLLERVCTGGEQILSNSIRRELSHARESVATHPLTPTGVYGVTLCVSG